MRFYLVRHGAAETATGDMRDADRRLTARGIERVRGVAAHLAAVGVRVDTLLTSPLPRAAETAAILADALGMPEALRVDGRLAPGFRFGDLQRIAAEHPGSSAMMLVGHQCDLGIVAGMLAGAGMLDVRKGGVVRVAAGRVEPGEGVLEWVLTPSALLGAGSD